MNSGLDYLKQEHRQFEQLFDQYLNSNDWESKFRTVDQMISIISGHASMEERYVHPLYRKKIGNKEGDFIADRCNLDDQINKELLQFLMDSKPEISIKSNSLDIYDATVKKFMSVEKDHITWEDDVFFPKLKLLCTPEELNDLYNSLMSSLSTNPTHPHPLAPNKPSTGAKILHPLAGIVDRAVDSISDKFSSG